MIKFKQLIPEQIEFLKEDNFIYLLDYRALGESLEYEIPSMRKYENILPWILNGQNIFVNQYAKQLNYPNNNNLIIVETESIAKKALITRREEQKLTLPKTLAWFINFVPHPELDNLSKKYDKSCFYLYSDFLKFNNKIEQKKIVSHTPEWKIVSSYSDIVSLENKQKWYIKRNCWSGGFTVFKCDSVESSTAFKELFNNPEEWYLEKAVDWLAMSVQILIEKNCVSVFWLTRQFVRDEKEFCGAQCLPLTLLEEDLFLRKELLKTIDELTSGLLSGYQGFWGIDFIYDREKEVYYFLEANVRLTAMTIPTLLYNQDPSFSLFYEDLTNDALQGKEYKVLSYDEAYDCYDVLIKE